MIYPSISQYIESVKDAEDNFATLTNLRPVLGEDGNPVMTSGNFAVVFKMRDVETGKFYAVKCFLKDQPNRAESYRLITEELEDVASTTTYLTKFKYVDKELFVDTNNFEEDGFPVLLMEWVEGVTLDKYIRQHIDDKYELRMLAYRFSRLAMWLIPQPFAHGDIKSDNIIVREDGSLTLIDYDGMYVPAMKGQKARELGSPDFRHPLRTENYYNDKIDDFALTSVLLSLRAIAYEPSLLEKYGTTDRLLFSETDYRDITACQVLNELFPSNEKEINVLVCAFIIALTQSDISKIQLSLLSLNKPDNLNDIITDLGYYLTSNYWVDQYGAKYSRDKKILFFCDNGKLIKYSIIEGCEIVCDHALEECYSLKELSIPESVKAIGGRSIPKCEIINHSPYFTFRDNILYGYDCTKLIRSYNSQSKISIPFGVTSIGGMAFEGNRGWYNQTLHEIEIPKSVKTLGDEAFSLCTYIEKIQLPESIIKIGKNAFAGCFALKSISIPARVVSIGEAAFQGCESLTEIDIKSPINSIEEYTFGNCKSLFYLSLPETVMSIGSGAFYGCYSLKEITIPHNVKTLGDNPFAGCRCVLNNKSDSFNVKDNILYDKNYTRVISCYNNSESITLPNTVKSIGNLAFCECKSLKKIILPSGLERIGDSAFEGCNSLASIQLPDSIKFIGEYPFLATDDEREWINIKHIYVSSKSFNRIKNILPKYLQEVLMIKEDNQ